MFFIVNSKSSWFKFFIINKITVVKTLFCNKWLYFNELYCSFNLYLLQTIVLFGHTFHLRISLYFRGVAGVVKPSNVQTIILIISSWGLNFAGGRLVGLFRRLGVIFNTSPYWLEFLSLIQFYLIAQCSSNSFWIWPL